MDVQDGKCLLLSKYGLDAKPYNEESTSNIWEDSSIRKWVNNDFISTAFTLKEQEAILTTQVDNSSAQGYNIWNVCGSDNTMDWIFLLSYTEANKYLGVVYGQSNNLKSRMSPTAYAIARNAYTNYINKTEEDNPTGWWWLRSPCPHQDRAADVSHNGSLTEHRVNDNRGAVRPVLWLNLKSDIF